MKSVLTVIVALFVTSIASANTRQDILRTALAGEIVSVKSLCPANVVCVTNGTVIELKFQPKSACGDLTVKYAEDEKAANVVNVTAIEETNAKMACIAVMPDPQYETITLVNTYAPMILNFVGTDVSYEILPEDVNAVLSL